MTFSVSLNLSEQINLDINILDTEHSFTRQLLIVGTSNGDTCHFTNNFTCGFPMVWLGKWSLVSPVGF